MKRKDSLKETKCTVCEQNAFARFENVPYCKRHYMQMYHHGKILNRTIYDSNEYILYDDYAECKTYDKSGNITGIIKVDLNKVDILKNYKIYTKLNNYNKPYAMMNLNSKKVLLHRYLMNIHEEKYSVDNVIDHINGDSMDNRILNLRICCHKDNMKNIKKSNKIIGVSKLKNGKYAARIMHNYKGIHLGYFDNEQDAILSRLQKEHELCGEYGPNKDSYYLLNLDSKAEESV